jgi:hypothetical protein
MPGILEREILLARDIVARTAAALATEPAQRWMLSLSREVRRSYVHEVLDAFDVEVAQQAWMLRQSDRLRESYIGVVLQAGEKRPRPDVVWMLRQPEAVRHSYVRDVLGFRP